MKKIFLLLFALQTIGAFAYPIAGDISYTHISGKTYKITVRVYANTTGVSDSCELFIFFGDGDGGSAICINGSSNLCPGGHDGIEIGTSCTGATKYRVYEAMHTYPSDGTYLITLEYPNMAPGICNIPNSVDQSFFLQAEIIINSFLGTGNGPEYTSLPITCDTVGIIATYLPTEIDVDGDSLSYELLPDGLGISGSILPQASTYFSIDPVVGIVTWNAPVLPCTYVFAIKTDLPFIFSYNFPYSPLLAMLFD